jgi:molecular chaperone HtpG
VGPPAARSGRTETACREGAVDNWVVTSLPEFEVRRLQSVTQGAPDFGALQDEAEHEAGQKAAAAYAGLVARLKAILAGQAWDVRVDQPSYHPPGLHRGQRAGLTCSTARRS